MPDVPILILTSRRTASGAEAFSYHLRSYDRATIVGETTKGIAHWIDPVEFPEHRLKIHIPYGRPENPVTHTSWEKVGVQPDIATSADAALAVAHLEALTKLLKECPDEEVCRILEWDLATVQARAEPIQLDLEKMSVYTGVYADGKYSVVIKDGKLCWRYSEEEEYLLLPLNADLFVFENDEEIRFKIYRDKKGLVSAFQLVYSDGYQGNLWPRTGDLS